MWELGVHPIYITQGRPRDALKLTLVWTDQTVITAGGLVQVMKMLAPIKYNLFAFFYRLLGFSSVYSRRHMPW